ncbi:MAG: hypothetical protein FJW23_17280 [Acidimicrobiia bacterium]|nr:hypothetical protein [Acidimicrobiia bacterium]
MSASASHHSKQQRRLCQDCRDRKARFRHRGAVRADRDHTLCFQCFRAERDRRRAALLEPVASGAALHPPAPLTETGIAHRRRMLAHLRGG